MNLRAAIPLGTLGLLLGACSSSGDGQGDQSQLNTAGTTGFPTSAGGASPGVVVGAGSTPTTSPSSTGSGGTTSPSNTGTGMGGAVVPPGSGGSTITPPGAGGTTAIGSGGTTGVGTGGTTQVGMGGTTGIATGGTTGMSSGNGIPSGSNDGPGIKIAQIQTVKIPLVPGQETVKCQNFDNPLGGVDSAVVETDSEMVSSHHMFVFHDPSFKNTNSVADCSGIEFHDLFHMAQTPEQFFVYPPNVGRILKGSEGIRVLVHLLNTTSDAQTAQVTIKFHYGATTAVKNIAVSLFLNTALLSVPPGMSTQSRTSGPLPATTNLLSAVSHMHSRAVNFTAKSSDGVMIYQGTEWNEPKPTYFQAPYPKLKQGTTINWACTYNNTTGQTLTFGESANTNEMCILAGVVWPDQQGLDLGTGYEWVI